MAKKVAQVASWELEEVGKEMLISFKPHRMNWLLKLCVCKTLIYKISGKCYNKYSCNGIRKDQHSGSAKPVTVFSCVWVSLRENESVPLHVTFCSFLLGYSWGFMNDFILFTNNSYFWWLSKSNGKIRIVITIRI